MPTTTTTTTTTPMPTTIIETVLIGTKSNTLYNVEYNANGASIVNTEQLGSAVASVIYGEKTNKAYVSTYANLYSYAISYYNSGQDIQNVLSVSNDDASIISTYRKSDDALWEIQSYNGKVVKINSLTLAVIKEYSGFDAPFKMKYSDFHGVYFVAGSHILWKLNAVDDSVTACYEINDYLIKDFEVSEDGTVCILLSGTEKDIIRILNNDLYTFAFNEEIMQGDVSFCKYCNTGRFYVLVEVYGDRSNYNVYHYLFDTTQGTVNKVYSSRPLLVTTTTTTLGVTTKAVKVTSPYGGENVQIGKQFDIKWISSKGSNDFVKIELYSGNILHSVLSEKTENTGIFSWNVATDINDSTDYKIKITWLAISGSSNDYDISSGFSILANIVTTTTTTTLPISLGHAVGIDFGESSEWILIVLNGGAYIIFDINSFQEYGLLELGISNPSSIATKSMVINGLDKQIKVRVFVGTDMYLNNMWDSGIVETELTSMYYGGGSNLEPGKKYYVHIQVYSAVSGWSEVQISEFVVPK